LIENPYNDGSNFVLKTEGMEMVLASHGKL